MMTTWNVVGTTEKTALGELQQPSPIGTPAEDGPMSWTDNAVNSEEQSHALQHWVEAFDHEMTQNGGDAETAIAILADKGCPDPQAVADMWIHQQENPDTTEDLSEMTPPEDPAMQAPPQELAQAPQQPLASTKTADISPDVAHFVSLLESGMDPEKLYRLAPNQHPLIDEAVRQHGQGSQPIIDPSIQNPGRAQLDQEMHDTTQDLLSLRNPNAKVADVASDEYGTGLDTPGAEQPLEQPTGDPIAEAKEWLHDCFDDDLDAMDYIDTMSPEETQAKVEQFFDGGWEGFLEAGVGVPPESDFTTPVTPGGESMEDMAMRDASTKTADLAGKGPKRDKANEIYKAIRRDTNEDKSSAAAIANAEANDLEKKGDLALGNDDDEKKDDKNPFAKKDKSDSKDDDSKKDKDDKDGDDNKPPWLKKKDSRASYQGLNGVISATFNDLWNGDMIILSTEHGDLTVPAGEVEAPTADAAAEENPVQEINDFLAIIDPAGHVPASFHARIENLSQVVTAGRKVIQEGKVSLADQMALDEIILKSAAEITELTKLAEEYVSEGDQQYLDEQPAYGIGAGGIGATESMGGNDAGGMLDEVYHEMMAETQATDFDKIVSEEPALLVSDMPDSVLGDQGAAAEMATSYISSKTGLVPSEIAKEITAAFVANVEQARRVALAQRKASMKRTAAAVPEADGPAEGLFY